jgi:ribosomal protein S18 acetylase RimI-like enzyme
MIRVRAARPAEALELSDLALRSKAHWGYAEVFLEACRAELTIGRDDIEREVVAVLDDDGAMRGFYLLRAQADGDDDSPSSGELDFFYLDPALIGAGHGRRLWHHMVVSAHQRGYKHIDIHSDPHAEGFYRAMGAQRVGEVESGSIEGRLLPLLRFDLEEGDPGV